MQHSWTICIFIIFHWNSQGQSTNQFLFLRDPQGLITPRASLINIQIGNRRQLSLMLIKAGEFHPQKPTMKSVLVLECVLHNLFFFHFYYFRNYFWNQMCLSSVQFNGLRHICLALKTSAVISEVIRRLTHLHAIWRDICEHPAIPAL